MALFLFKHLMIDGKTKWLGIETAPRDGTAVLVADGADIMVAAYVSDAWSCPHYDVGVINPTHWMPLPDPPQR